MTREQITALGAEIMDSENVGEVEDCDDLCELLRAWDVEEAE